MDYEFKGVSIEQAERTSSQNRLRAYAQKIAAEKEKTKEKEEKADGR